MIFLYIGYAGLVNLSLLALITVWRLFVFISTVPSGEFLRRTFLKKLSFHVLLTCSVVADIPMYVGFITTEDYVNSYYGLHKLQSALLFCAYSIIIRDWSKVLFELNELGHTPFYFSKLSLIILNLYYVSFR
jgi:hypothetical protein